VYFQLFRSFLSIDLHENKFLYIYWYVRAVLEQFPCEFYNSLTIGFVQHNDEQCNGNRTHDLFIYQILNLFDTNIKQKQKD